MKNEIELRVEKLTTEQLQEMATMLMKNYSDGTTLVFDVVINELENRMSESDYVKFCNNL